MFYLKDMDPSQKGKGSLEIAEMRKPVCLHTEVSCIYMVVLESTEVPGLLSREKSKKQ